VILVYGIFITSIPAGPFPLVVLYGGESGGCQFKVAALAFIAVAVALAIIMIIAGSQFAEGTQHQQDGHQ
jgi:hypothetical protein